MDYLSTGYWLVVLLLFAGFGFIGIVVASFVSEFGSNARIQNAFSSGQFYWEIQFYLLLFE